MNISEIKHQIIAPTLREIGLYSDTALNLAAYKLHGGSA